MWELWKGNCLELMKIIPDNSIDLIICDLPYGTTKCKWDIILPFNALWHEYKRIIKERRAIVLFGTEPFSSYLRLSNINWYKYDWIWDKKHGANFAQGNKRPLKNYELISVFYEKQCNYFPQKILNPKGLETRQMYKPSKQKTVFVGQVAIDKEFTLYGSNYEPDKLLPKAIIQFSRDPKPVHPTQKPVQLYEYLIKTYTNENDLILDNCAGSGTAGIAAENCNRNCIMIENDLNYCDIILSRMKNAGYENKENTRYKILFG